MRRMTIPEKSYSFPLAFSVPIGVIAHQNAVALGNRVHEFPRECREFLISAANIFDRSLGPRRHIRTVLHKFRRKIDLTNAQILSVGKFFEVISDKFSECVIAVPGSLQALAAWLRKLPWFSSRKGSSLRGARPSRFSSVSAGPADFPLM